MAVSRKTIENEINMTKETYTIGEVIVELNKFIDSFPTIQDAADELGVSRVFLWRVQNEHRLPSQRILDRLGFKLERKINYVYHKVR